MANSDRNETLRDRKIRSYREFWPHYLREHALPRTRAFHLAGTGLSILCIVAFVLSGNLWFVPAAVVAGYGPAWTAHFFIEKNKPATFSYPVWSLAADYHMAWTWLMGHLGEELERAGVQVAAAKEKRDR